MENRNGGASTAVLEPVELRPLHERHDVEPLPTKPAPSLAGHSLGSSRAISLGGQSNEVPDGNETLPSPTTASEHVETWKSPRTNIYRIIACFWSFVLMGMNDATYGAIIPYLEEYYGSSYLIISLIFLTPFFGYNIAAILNNAIHLKFGQRGVAFLGPLCHLIAYVVIALHPPYPVLAVFFAFAGLGNGIEDSAWNAWLGAMANANEILGFLHGLYGIGATVAPLISTALVTKAGVPWYYWYYIMVRLPIFP